MRFSERGCFVASLLAMTSGVVMTYGPGSPASADADTFASAESGTHMTTLIRTAEIVVAWDAGTQTHAYMPDADVAFDGGALTFVGRNYAGPADETIDGKGLMVMPGLVDIHSHPSSEM